MSWFEMPLALQGSDDEGFLLALRAAVDGWPTPESPPRFVVAFSGGLDSTVLLAALCRLGVGPRLRAAYVDHGLNPASAQWGRHCADVASELGVAFASTRVHVPGSSGFGQEAAAREARYGALAALLGPGDVLLTAHHGDDQLETLLLRLFRGSGVRGMRGIIEFGPFGPGYLGRPLLHCTRAELRARALTWNLRWLEDPSNQATRHDRNFLRAAVIPRVLERWPAAVANAGRLAGQMDAAEELLDEVAANDAAAIQEPWRVPKAVLLALSPARQRNLMRYLLRACDLPVPGAQKLDEILRLVLLRRDAQPLVRWPGGEARLHREHLWLSRPLPTPSAKGYSGRLGINVSWSGPEGEVVLEPTEAGAGLPHAWVTSALSLRFRRGGERLVLGAPAHSHALGDWLREQGIVPWMRDRIPLIYRGTALIAVGDLWVTPDAANVGPDEPRWRILWRGHRPIR